jgi:MHS family proline/betaine transporter-like MFS transporter
MHNSRFSGANVRHCPRDSPQVISCARWGGILFGHLGDRLARKTALQVSIVTMSVPTILTGLLPTYANIGVVAAILLVLLRMIQGVSVGGELIGSISYVSEIAPPRRKGFYGSWAVCSAIVGIMR